MSIDPQSFGELMADVKHIKSKVDKQDGEVDILKTKVGKLEKFQAALLGAWAAAGTGLGAAFTKVFG